jgi:hypothetical protein
MSRRILVSGLRFLVDKKRPILIRHYFGRYKGGGMQRIDVNGQRIDGAWLMEKAESLGITMPPRPEPQKAAESQKQGMDAAVSEMERFFDPLAGSPIISHRRILGHGIIFLKKALRKLLKPLFSALINTQRLFNSKVLEWVKLQHQWDQSMDEKVTSLEKIIRDLNNRIEELEKALEQSYRQREGKR